MSGDACWLRAFAEEGCGCALGMLNRRCGVRHVTGSLGKVDLDGGFDSGVIPRGEILTGCRYPPDITRS